MAFQIWNLRALARLSILSILLAACSIPPDTSRVIGENATTAEARKELVGLDQDDIRMCAGFPTATSATADGGSIWAYRADMPRGSWNVVNPAITLFGAIPAVNSSASVNSGGNCSTQFRFAKGKVDDVEYAGDNNTRTDLNGLCVSMVDNCVAYARHKTGK
ncbi:hypothetical protein [Neorhizobium sp. NCHU2750]|uniref:hypothetical protein n=1 Tax=Neorhizobium sp. NCHU2750 TaxID=1825976 RepID=UPI000EB66CEB|nr:hypothetical protein NCHU2750_14890 [Neorhizobium sp. NCHU2750]